jgi:short-subunit dehydrogenase
VKEDSPEFVAETGVDALFEGKLFVISGARNYVTPWIARFLPRKTVVRMVGTMWKQFLDS